MAEPPVYYLQQQLGLVRGFDKEVADLSEKLDAIDDFLLEAKARQFCNGGYAMKWVDILKELCYDVDGELGQWCSDKQQLRDAKKVSFYVPWAWFRGRPDFNQVVTASKIKKLARRVDEIAKLKYFYTVITERFEFKPVKTKPDIGTEVYGRESEKEWLVDKLLGEGGDTIPIVGMAGIGKTTLAKLAYNDKKVEHCFDHRIWVHAGSSFDLIRVMTEIIQSIKGYVPDLSELESLSWCVEKSLKEKKFLLVLDDVWTDDEMKWSQLKGSLRLGAGGAKIVVTTRRKHVVFMTGAENHAIRLGELSEEPCWRLFSDKAFHGRSQEERARLEETGRRIARRCKGLPLFSELLGRRLASQTEEQWEDVACRELWELDGEMQSIFTSFLPSYYALSALEKRCLSYCSIFPKDYEIDRADLIELWRAEGYLIGNGYIETGESCCKSLVMESIFQDCGKDFDGNITKYRMHSTMNAFLQFVVMKESLVEKSSGIEEEVNQDRTITRHCTLLLESGAQIPDRIYHKTNLRTLFVQHSETSDSMHLSNLLPELRSLRTFCLPRCCIKELPASIDKLMHLRYLNLTDNSEIMELPNELCNLINLQTLRLTGCIQLQRLPEQIGKLLNLHHLYINRCHQLKELPKGIGRLTEIRVLDMFVVFHGENRSLSHRAMKLGDLNELTHIQGQKMHIRECTHLNYEDAKKAQLRSKEYLAELQLSFSENSLTDVDENEILEALEPHQNLTSLVISHYHSSVFPKWMSCVSFNLKRLRLSNCECKSLPPLGKLPWLVFLHVEGMENVKKVGIDVLETGESHWVSQKELVSFPRLRELHFSELPNWEKWEWGIESGKDEYAMSAIMPRLESFSICSCPKLEQLPGFLTEKMKGKTLDIKDCIMLEKFFLTGMEKSEGEVSKSDEKNPSKETEILEDQEIVNEYEQEETEKSEGDQSKFDKKKLSKERNRRRRKREKKTGPGCLSRVKNMLGGKRRKEAGPGFQQRNHHNKSAQCEGYSKTKKSLRNVTGGDGKERKRNHHLREGHVGRDNKELEKMGQIVQFIWECNLENIYEDYKHRDTVTLQRFEYVKNSAAFKSIENWAR